MIKNNKEINGHGSIRKLRTGAVVSVLSLSILGATTASADVVLAAPESVVATPEATQSSDINEVVFNNNETVAKYADTHTNVTLNEVTVFPSEVSAIVETNKVVMAENDAILVNNKAGQDQTDALNKQIEEENERTRTLTEAQNAQATAAYEEAKRQELTNYDKYLADLKAENDKGQAEVDARNEAEKARIDAENASARAAEDTRVKALNNERDKVIVSNAQKEVTNKANAEFNAQEAARVATENERIAAENAQGHADAQAATEASRLANVAARAENDRIRQENAKAQADVNAENAKIAEWNTTKEARISSENARIAAENEASRKANADALAENERIKQANIDGQAEVEAHNANEERLYTESVTAREAVIKANKELETEVRIHNLMENARVNSENAKREREALAKYEADNQARREAVGEYSSLDKMVKLEMPRATNYLFDQSRYEQLQPDSVLKPLVTGEPSDTRSDNPVGTTGLKSSESHDTSRFSTLYDAYVDFGITGLNDRYNSITEIWYGTKNANGSSVPNRQMLYARVSSDLLGLTRADLSGGKVDIADVDADGVQKFRATGNVDNAEITVSLLIPGIEVSRTSNIDQYLTKAEYLEATQGVYAVNIIEDKGGNRLAAFATDIYDGKVYRINNTWDGKKRVLQSMLGSEVTNVVHSSGLGVYSNEFDLRNMVFQHSTKVPITHTGQVYHIRTMFFDDYEDDSLRVLSMALHDAVTKKGVMLVADEQPGSEYWVAAGGDKNVIAPRVTPYSVEKVGEILAEVPMTEYERVTPNLRVYEPQDVPEIHTKDLRTFTETPLVAVPEIVEKELLTFTPKQLVANPTPTPYVEVPEFKEVTYEDKPLLTAEVREMLDLEDVPAEAVAVYNDKAFTPLSFTAKQPTAFVSQVGNPPVDKVFTPKKLETYVPETYKGQLTTIKAQYRTIWVDEDGNPLSPEVVAELVQPAGTIDGYEFMTTRVNDDGATHVFKKVIPPVVETPKTQYRTVWVDEEGNILKPEVVSEVNQLAGTIDGYEFVVTRTDGNYVTHVFKKIVPPVVEAPKEVKPEAPRVVEVKKETPKPVVQEPALETPRRTLPNTGDSSSLLSLLGGILLGVVLPKRFKKRE